MAKINWVSTDETIEKGEFTLLAIAETVFAVTVYWLIAWYFDTHLHLVISLCVAPLLLLRSHESVEMGVRQFAEYLGQAGDIEEFPYWSITCSLLIAFAVVFLTFRLLFGEPEFWHIALAVIGFPWAVSVVFVAIIRVVKQKNVFEIPFRKFFVGCLTASVLIIVVAIMSGVSASVIVVFAVDVLLLLLVIATAAKIILFGLWIKIYFAYLSLIVGTPAGIFLRSIIIRLSATVLNIRKGIFALPGNWKETLFVIDTFHLPELGPGFSLVNPTYGFRRSITRLKTKNLRYRIVAAVSFPVFFLPAYLYRLSIKSTCWFYLPLVYLAHAPSFDAADQEDFLMGVRHSAWDKVRLTLSGITVVAVILTTFSTEIWLGLIGTANISPFAYVLAIDLGALKPWNWFALTGAVITFALFFACDRLLIRLHVNRKRDSGYQMDIAMMGLLRFLMRFRNVATVGWLLVALVHFILLHTEAGLYIPAGSYDLMRGFYGDALPG